MSHILSKLLTCSFKLDETYTPSEIAIRSGTTFNDLVEVKKLTFNKAEGWVNIQLSDEEECLRTNFLQIVIIAMHLGINRLIN
jgi:anaphase-promoting complex subunit 10